MINDNDRRCFVAWVQPGAVYVYLRVSELISLLLALIAEQCGEQRRIGLRMLTAS